MIQLLGGAALAAQVREAVVLGYFGSGLLATIPNCRQTRSNSGSFRLARDPKAQSAVTKLIAPAVPAGASLARQPMNNLEIPAAWKYHDGTKHSYWSIRNHPHFLDWANRPLPFKIYPKIAPLPLPWDVPQTGVALLSAVSEPVPSSLADSVPGVQDLARLLYFSAGITKQRAYPGGEVYFRAAACTGALYEIELYVLTGDLPDLDAGVYHFNPADVSLRYFFERRFPGETGSGDGDGTRGGSRARDDHHRNVLAERLKYQARISPFRLDGTV